MRKLLLSATLLAVFSLPIHRLYAQQPTITWDAHGLMVDGKRVGSDIDYQGGCARLYADGKLIADNFYYGRHFQYGLWRLPEGVTELELSVLPMQENMPVYFPEEADTTPGEKVVGVTLFPSDR